MILQRYKPVSLLSVSRYNYDGSNWLVLGLEGFYVYLCFLPTASKCSFQYHNNPYVVLLALLTSPYVVLLALLTSPYVVLLALFISTLVLSYIESCECNSLLGSRSFSSLYTWNYHLWLCSNSLSAIVARWERSIASTSTNYLPKR